MSEPSTEFVTVEQVGEAIRKCVAAHPEYTSKKLLHPDAALLCDALGEMNYRKLTMVKRSALQDKHLDALMRWSE